MVFGVALTEQFLNEKMAEDVPTLPQGWVSVPLSAVTRTRSGNSKLIKGTLSQEKTPALFPAFSASGQDVWMARAEHEGDAIILSAVGARCGKAFLATGRWSAIANTHIIFPNTDLVDTKWLWYKTNNEHFWVRSGSAQPFLKVGKTLERIVALPPRAEQRRIVARIDAYFDEINEGAAALAAARKGLEIFRRALLKAAVTGELTKVWRAANPTIETGHELLARVVKNRKDQALAKGRIRQSAKDFPLSSTALPVIPKSWVWATVRDVGVVQLGRQRAPQHHAGENMRPYLRVANVYEDRIDFRDVKEMNFTPAEFETYQLKSGDILLNEGQTPDFLGRPAMWRGEFEGYCFQNTLLRFQARAPMNAEFCLLVFRHYLHAKRFKKASQITTNIAHLSSGRFVIIEFPVPPLDEQIEIVRLVSEGLNSAADTLAMLDAEAADAARLKQSVLKAAFEGRLAPQDPADDPASVLLNREAAEQVTTNAKRGPAKRVS